MNIAFPTSPDALTPDLLTKIVAEAYPDVTVTGFEVTERHLYGEGDVSAAARLGLRLTYADCSCDLPRDVVVKIDRASNSPYPLYANEVAAYAMLRPHRIMEAPRYLGGTWDEETGRFGLILEDLRLRAARFPRAVDAIGVDQVRRILDTTARLHATYWRSPAFGTPEMAWLQTHVAGPVHDLFTDPERRPKVIAHEVETVQFKREMVQRLGVTLPDLAALTARLHRWQSGLVQTIVHGDLHIGNTYILPDGTPGLLDWQLCVRGYPLHDICYLLATALNIADRRAYERDLLAYYRNGLAERGVPDCPDMDELWLEYRRAAVWGVYIGWLTTPLVNYGWEVTLANMLRVATAMEDLRTIDALADVP